MSSLEHPTAPSTVPAAPAMSGAVFRGSFWMMTSTAATRAASFAAQILLGALLAKTDFGLYALAISVSALATVLKDGGVKQVLVQRQRDYDRLIGPVFWMALAFNAATGAVLAGLAPVLAWAYGAPTLTWLLLVIALTQPLLTPGAILATRLQIDMRFREAGLIATVSALVRYLGAVLLAILGFGAMSFVLPLPILALIEWVMGWWYVRERPWRRRAEPRVWWPLFRDTRWVVAGTLGVAGVNLGSNMVIGFFVPMSVVGVYFFAYQIVVQIGVMVAANFAQVLVSALARIADDLTRKRAAAERALRQVMLLSAPMCLGLVATFTPLELLIWKGKWADAAGAVQITGLFYPALIAATVAQSVKQARGRFRAWGLGVLGMAAATLAGAAAGAIIHGSAAGVALYTGVVGTLAALAVTLSGMAEIGVRPGTVARAVAPAWLLAIAAAGIAMVIDLYVFGGPTAPAGFTGASTSALRLHALMRTCLTGAIFCTAFAVLARLLLTPHLREALAVTPSRLRPLVAAVLRLR